MLRHPIPYRATGRFSPIVSDHVEGEAALSEFYAHRPDREGLSAAMRTRTFDPATRMVLCDVLRDQYHGIAVGEAVRANLEALRRNDVLTVTTGHQLCLFTGPLYVPFKILNVIRLARELSTDEHNVIPVFWMATEDHDRAEIDHAWLDGAKVEWPGAPAGAVGRLPLTGIDAAVEQAGRVLGIGPHADELRALLNECYRPEHTLAHATRLFVHALFGRFGVVIVDGDDPRLKSVFAPMMREEILNGVTSRAVHYANERLRPRYQPQAHARELNLFLLQGLRRERLEPQGGGFVAHDTGTYWSVQALLDRLDAAPEEFSPNVLLRPLYQETILPNIAYVGGGGELAYWLQLRWVFQAMRVPMPPLVLRTSAAFISTKLADKWRASGLSIADLFTPKAELEKRIALEHATFSTSLEAERAEHARLFGALAERVTAADPTLEASVRAKEAFSRKGLDLIERRLVRAAKRQQADRLRQLGEVHDALFAHGLAERRDNFMSYYAAKGPALFDEWLDALDPLDPRFSVLEGD